LGAYQTKIETLNSLLKLGKAINSTLDLNELLKLAMELVTEVVKAEASSLILKEKFTKDLFVHVATGEKEKIVKQIRIPKGKGITGWVANNKKTLLIVEALSSIVDTKNPSGHSKRVMGYSLLIATEMGLERQEKDTCLGQGLRYYNVKSSLVRSP